MEHSLLTCAPSPPSSSSSLLPVSEEEWDEDESELSDADLTLYSHYCRQFFDEQPLTASSGNGSRNSDWERTAGTGIDTLKLFFPVRPWRRVDFHLVQRSEVRGRDVGEGMLWRAPDDSFGYGAMAVARSGAFRFRIAPVGGDIKLRVFFSAPAVAYGHNAHTITRTDLVAVLEQMQEVLHDKGLEIDWREGQVSRVDVHRDVALPRPFSYYLQALQLIEPPYGRLWGNYPTGVLRGAATSLVYALYDKRAQCQEKKAPLPPDTNTFPAWMRCEARLPTAAAVRRALKVGTCGELVDKFEELSPWLDERIERDLLNEEVPDCLSYPHTPLPTVTPHDERWWQTQMTGDGVGFKDRMALIGLRLAYATIGPHKFWEIAKERDFDGTLQPAKVRAQFRHIALHSHSDQMLPIALLYQELKQTLLTSKHLDVSL